MSQNYDIFACFPPSNNVPTKMFTLKQKNVEDPMNKLVGAVNSILSKSIINTIILGTNEYGEIVRNPMSLRITNIPMWQYLPEQDILIAPFSTDIGLNGFAIIKETE